MSALPVRLAHLDHLAVMASEASTGGTAALVQLDRPGYLVSLHVDQEVTSRVRPTSSLAHLDRRALPVQLDQGVFPVKMAGLDKLDYRDGMARSDPLAGWDLPVHEGFQVRAGRDPRVRRVWTGFQGNKVPRVQLASRG